MFPIWGSAHTHIRLAPLLFLRLSQGWSSCYSRVLVTPHLGRERVYISHRETLNLSL